MEINQLAVNWIGREIKGRQGDKLGAVALMLARRVRGEN